MLQIDGSLGEGGGQVLRTSLALSLVTGTPVSIVGIRARRRRPGLMRQHLTCVLAAAAVGDARVDGAALDSRAIEFAPGRVRGGDHRFTVGTAGSTTLVLQTVLPALLHAPAPSTVTIAGGTHNPMAPPYDFVARAFARALRHMGAKLDVQLLRHGFAPAGGGAIASNIGPSRLCPTSFLARTSGLRGARALLANLPRHVAERELAVVRRRLSVHPEQLRVEEVDAEGPGNMLLVELPGDPFDEVVAIAGERGKPAEQVAEEACGRAEALLGTGAAVGEHLSDQLLLPLAIAGGGAMRTVAPSLHARTNAAVIERFLPVRFEQREDRDGSWVVECRSRS